MCSETLTICETFFNRFAEDFSEFSGQLIATRYHEPYVAIDQAGNTRLFTSRRQIGEYFQSVLDNYRDQGCQRCRFDSLEWNRVSERFIQTSVTWELYSDQDDGLISWRETYHLLDCGALVNGDRCWKVISTVDH